DGAADRELPGRAGDRDVRDIGASDRAAPARYAAALRGRCRLREDTDAVSRTGRQTRGEGECAIGRDREVAAPVVLKHETTADQPADVAADRETILGPLRRRRLRFVHAAATVRARGQCRKQGQAAKLAQATQREHRIPTSDESLSYRHDEGIVPSRLRRTDQ